VSPYRNNIFHTLPINSRIAVLTSVAEFVKPAACLDS